MSSPNPRVRYWLDAIEARLRAGEPLVLYHGTTAQFSRFDLSKSRKELVDSFYGEGIFFTTSKKAAWRYAYAARNQGLPPDVIEAVGRKNRKAALVLRAFVEQGRDIWESPGVSVASLEASAGGVDLNALIDLSKHVRGSRYADPVDEDEEIRRALLGNQTYGTPGWVFKILKKLGVEAKLFMPKVYTAEVRLVRPLWTASTDKARRARALGFDSVVYYGRDLVDDAPEVAVFDPAHVKIKEVEFDEP